jgi:hypothetical protein
MAHAVSHQALTTEVQLHAQVSQYGISGGQSGIGTDFSLSSSVFLCQYHSTVALHTHIIQTYDMILISSEGDM